MLFAKFPASVVDIYGELFFFSLLLRMVNDQSTACREMVNEALSALVSSQKVSANKLKAIFNSLMKMGENKSALEPTKRDQIFLAKMYGIQLMVSHKQNSTDQQILKLKPNDLKEIVQQCCDQIIQSEYSKLQEQVNKMLVRQKRRKEDSDGDEATAENEEVQRFLKAIELAEQEDGEAAEEDLLQSAGKQYSILFTALQTIEKLLVNQSKKAVVGEIARLGLSKQCLLFAQYHATHWIRHIA